MKRAFTLAEVLITLTVIGVIAAMTVPSLYNNIRVAERNAQLKTVYTDFSQAYLLATQDLGFWPKCGYWDKNPYGGHSCVERYENGNCKRYELDSGEEWPGDKVNGLFSQCTIFGEAILNRLGGSTPCTDGALSCLGYEYEGYDDIVKGQNPDFEDYDINAKVSGVGGFSRSQINSSYIIELPKGPIIVGYGGGVKTFNPRIYAIDINGRKGPNRFGYDLHAFRSVYSTATNTTDFDTWGGYLSSGGVSASDIIKNKTTDHKLNKK